MKPISLFIITAVLGAFGMLTLFMSSSVIFDLFNIRVHEGNYVLFIVDFSADGKIGRRVILFYTINNVSDKVYAVARRPAGLRPGLPRTFQAGVRVNL